MENRVFTYYNKLTKRFNGVFEYESQELALYRIQKNQEFETVIKPELELCEIGVINIENGVITPHSAPIHLNWNESEKIPITENK